MRVVWLFFCWIIGNQAIDIFSIAQFNNSAELGNPEAQFSLGWIYEMGRGTTTSSPISQVYLKFSASSGYAPSEMAMGYKYYFGHGVTKSCEKAASYYESASRKAAEKFEKEGEWLWINFRGSSFSHLDNLYVDEATTEEDLEEILSQRGRFSLSKSRKDIQRVTKEEGDLVDLYHFSASSGDVAAMVAVGLLYLKGGYGVEVNYEQAEAYFEEAITLFNDSSAFCYLGMMKEHGLGSAKDLEEAVLYYTAAADMGNSQAQFNLGYLHFHGTLGIPNLREALRYWTSASEHGHADALYWLGKLYLGFTPVGYPLTSTSFRVPKDPVKAFQILNRAAQQGHPLALHDVGVLYLDGVANTAPSCAMAVPLFKRVAEMDPDYSDWLWEAVQHYADHDLHAALIKFEQLALMGYQPAQHSAAYLYSLLYADHQKLREDTLDEDLTSTTNPPNLDATTAANYSAQKLIQHTAHFYSLAAEQKHSPSLVKLGDLYFDGLLPLPADVTSPAELAGRYYKLAADMRNAEATFNMAGLHHTGNGLPFDLHLAKRYYDLTLEYQPDSYLAVYLSFVPLLWDFLWKEWIPLATISPDTLILIPLCLILCLLLVIRWCCLPVARPQPQGAQ